MSELGLKQALHRLEQSIMALSPLVVAVSGGVDSMTLAFIANRVSPDTLMFHALSPAVPVSATDRVKRYAEKENWYLHLINAREMEDRDYIKNPVNRCYFCKSNLYRRIRADTSITIVSGTNIDDLNDFRPGLKAAEENNIHHPFVEAGIEKNTIRELAKYFTLTDLQELPAAPCLASRVTTGIAIDAGLLPLIDQAENNVRNLLADDFKLNAVRCRIREDHIAIELDTEEKIDASFPHADDIRATVNGVFHNTCFGRYTRRISIEAYKKGSSFIGVSSHG